MVMHVALNHRTTYRYDRSVSLGPQVVRLRPAPHCRTRDLELLAEGRAGPALHQLAAGPARQLAGPVRVPRADARACDRGRPRGRDGRAQPVRLLPRAVGRDDPRSPTSRCCARTSSPTSNARRPARCRALAGRRAARGRRAPSTSWSALNQRLLARHRLPDPHGAGHPDAANRHWRLRSGSCRDSGLAAGADPAQSRPRRAVRLGLPDPAQARREGARRPLRRRAGLLRPARLGRGLPAGCRLGRARPDLGPACRRRPHAARGHARPARTLRPSPASSTRARSTFDVAMSVRRIFEQPRVTQALYRGAVAGRSGCRPRRSTRGWPRSDVRLTVGGEPTFVVVDDRDAAEWNTEATGGTKEQHADELIRRLRDRFAPGGLLQYGQGKWYPGELLPRWAFALYWRGDGQPLWRDPGLVAGPSVRGRRHRRGRRALLPRRSPRGSALPDDLVIPAFEDPAHFVLQGALLPDNVEPARQQARRPAGARAAGTGVRSRAGVARRALRCRSSAGRHAAWRLAKRALGRRAAAGCS